MKIELSKIAEIVTDITDVSLQQMRMRSNSPEIVEARHIFMITAIEYGDYKNAQEIAEYVGRKGYSLDYPKKQRHFYTTLLELIAGKIEELKKDDIYNMQLAIYKMDWKTRLDLAQNIMSTIPKHKLIYSQI
jgi:hypothetical protein